MQNTARIGFDIVALGDVVGDGGPVVIWGINTVGADTVVMSNTDGDGGAGSVNVVTHTFTAANSVLSFPFGIQMKQGASITTGSGDLTVFYTKI